MNPLANINVLMQAAKSLNLDPAAIEAIAELGITSAVNLNQQQRLLIETLQMETTAKERIDAFIEAYNDITVNRLARAENDSRWEDFENLVSQGVDENE